MIHPEYLQKAANDPKIANALEKNLGEIPQAERCLQNMCKMSGKDLVGCGAFIDEDGGMSSWSVTRSAYRSKIQNKSENKKHDLLERYKKVSQQYYTDISDYPRFTSFSTK